MRVTFFTESGRSMKSNIFPAYPFQIFYISKEDVNSPFIGEIIRTITTIRDHCVLGSTAFITVSINLGRRILMLKVAANFKKIDQKDFLEIADYDPIKNLLLVIGAEDPYPENAIHWMIYHARNEINTIIQLDDEEIAERFIDKAPLTNMENSHSILEQTKEILRKLGEGNTIVLEGQGMMFVGRNLKEVEESIIKKLKG